jgi:predicted nucleotidyltransferase
MNTTPEQKQTGPLLIRSVSSPSVKVIYLDREAVRENLKQAVEALARRRPEIERVLLFGSLATGCAVPGSDADLFIMLTHSDRRFLDRIPLYMPEGHRVAVDVFPYTHAEIEKMRAAGHPFLTRALAEGIEIFSAPESSQIPV